jgi:hypothetical protein
MVKHAVLRFTYALIIHLIDGKSSRENKTRKRQFPIEDSIAMIKHPHSRLRLSEEASGLSIDPDVLEKL